MKTIKTMTAALLCAAAVPAYGRTAGEKDYGIATLDDTLSTAVVTAEKGITVSRCDTVSLAGCFSIEEALLKTPGAAVNDNGGISGLKTVSLRGLGSSQTGIYIDGIQVGNLMSGQTDLGMLGTGNLGSVIVDYAQNRINFRTAVPVFGHNVSRKVAGRFESRGGSFGTFSPLISLSFKCSDSITASVNSEGLISRSHRENSDIRQVKGGVDLFGDIPGGSWKAKTYVNASDRQSPGSTSYPYLSEQKDINSFIQGGINKRINSLYSLNLTGKAAYDGMIYTDSYSESRYGQTDTRINTSHLFAIREWVKLSYALGLNWNILKSNQYTTSTSSTDSNIYRLGGITSAAASFNHKAIRADISVEYACASDFSSQGSEGKFRQCLSPSASLSVKATEGLTVSSYGRRAYRIPTFNELYYAGFGNTDLEPEDAWLADIGAEFNMRPSEFWKIGVKADIFCNWLQNKITAAPSPEDPNIWLPYNIDKVRTAGTDICISSDYHAEGWEAEGSARYTFQDSQNSPYTSRHSLVLYGRAGYKGWELKGTWNLREGRTDSSGALPGWNTLDISIHKKLNIKDLFNLTLSLDAKNVTDFRYEISRGYPMPGWALFGSMAISF